MKKVVSELTEWLGTFVDLLDNFFNAFSENETGESPGGQDKHFCVPL